MPSNLLNSLGFWTPRSLPKDPFSSLSAEDMGEFALFVALTHVRTRSFLDNMGKLKVAFKEVQLFESEENLREGFMQSREREIERSVVLEEPFIWQYAYSLANKILQMNWSLFQADKDLSFFTSDNPVCFHQAPDPTKQDNIPLMQALYDSSVRVTLPLSPQFCWIGYWSNHVPDVYKADEGWIESFNTQRAKWADRFLFASEEKQETLEMRIHRVQTFAMKIPQQDNGFIPADVKTTRAKK